jgi:hypothetical protein
MGNGGLVAFDPQHVLTINFQIYTGIGLTADWWIDDLSFY